MLKMLRHVKLSVIKIPHVLLHMLWIKLGHAGPGKGIHCQNIQEMLILISDASSTPRILMKLEPAYYPRMAKSVFRNTEKKEVHAEEMTEQTQ